MAAPFHQTLATMRSDRFRRISGPLLVATLLLVLWGGWFFFAKLELVETTASARLELINEARSIQSPVAGDVTASHLELGKIVEAGDILVELDAKQLRLERSVKQAELRALGEQLTHFAPEVDAAERSLASDRKATAAARGEAEARRKEAEAAAELAEKELERTKQLYNSGHESQKAYERADAEHAQRVAAAKSRRLELLRRALDGKAAESDRRASIERLRREQTALEGQAETLRAKIAQLDYAIERRSLRAPVAGRLASVTQLHLGSTLAEGAPIATLLPDGEFEVIAHYPPQAALGRIYAGQRAKLRLDAYPATQYGSVPARVRTVASETRYGRVRVELELLADVPKTVSLQHGMPGNLEIEVEKATPAVVVLRAAGSLITGGS